MQAPQCVFCHQPRAEHCSTHACFQCCNMYQLPCPAHSLGFCEAGLYAASGALQEWCVATLRTASSNERFASSGISGVQMVDDISDCTSDAVPRNREGSMSSACSGLKAGIMAAKLGVALGAQAAPTTCTPSERKVWQSPRCRKHVEDAFMCTFPAAESALPMTLLFLFAHV
jgi:hypothetical protein